MTVFSNDNGQVIEASDNQGTYYYVADGLGEPTQGGWTNREQAIAYLHGTATEEPDVTINGRGERA